MKYIDLFAGVGGFRYGIERRNRSSGEAQEETTIETNSTNTKKGNTRESTFTCVYSNEWDKYANSVYKKHYEECDSRDIREVKAEELPDFDLLCGGFPCQSFSIAGKRGGFDDTRGTLFFEIARIIKQKRPRLLLLENVKGLLSHDKGRTFATIIGTLDELGYDVQWQVLNSKDFGVPQNRERVFIIGHLRGTSRPEVFPITNSNQKDIIQLNKPTHSKIVKAVLTPNRAKKRQNGRRMKTNGEPSFTLTGQDIHGIMLRDGRDNRSCLRAGRNTEVGYKGCSIRRLTPTECERLQGFPDSWTKYDADGKEVSDTQRYKMMGNAVTTKVITEIIKKLI